MVTPGLVTLGNEFNLKILEALAIKLMNWSLTG
jgi:hypothetical protein